MRTECATFTNGATAFDITFKLALYNLDDNQSIVTMAGGIIFPVWNGSQWITNTLLGENESPVFLLVVLCQLQLPGQLLPCQHNNSTLTRAR